MAYDNNTIAIYQLKSFIQNEDFNKIYENMEKNMNTKLIYNSSAYDYQPWGNKLSYNYMSAIIGFVIALVAGWCDNTVSELL